MHTLIQTAQDHKLDEDDVLNKVYVKDDHISASDYKLLVRIQKANNNGVCTVAVPLVQMYLSNFSHP